MLNALRFVGLADRVHTVVAIIGTAIAESASWFLRNGEEGNSLRPSPKAMGFSAGELVAPVLPEYYQSINWATCGSPKHQRDIAGVDCTRHDRHPQVLKTMGVGTDHGKPATIETWQATGRLGNLTVNFLQPEESQSNSYSRFFEEFTKTAAFFPLSMKFRPKTRWTERFSAWPALECNKGRTRD